MKYIELQSPVLRSREIPYSEFIYPVTSTKYLPQPNTTNSIAFLDVLENRTSRRTFNKIPLDILSTLLWHSARVINVALPSISPRWQHRPAPSGGGRHPIDLFIINYEKKDFDLFLYQPISHALSLLSVSSDCIKKLINAIEAVISVENASIIWLGAQFERTLSRYENGESIIWKDAGSLTATICLTAEYLGLNYCPVGITGEPYLSMALEATDKVFGVGGILVGAKQ